MELKELLATWDSPEGHPYKGSLIDWGAYQEDPTNIGCACAQGQVLHLIGGRSFDDLRNMAQEKADKEVADLLNISRGHAVLLRNINDSVDGAPSIVLTNPGKVLGNQWSKLLDFWWHLDQMTAKDWDAAGDAARDAVRDAAGDAARAAAGDAAWGAAWGAAWVAAGDAAGYAARDAARAAAGDAAWGAARDAAGEIQGAAIFTAAKRPFYFLPLFGFNSPDDIPARPANYGVPA